MIEHRGFRFSIQKTRTGYAAVVRPEVAIGVAGATRQEVARLTRDAIDLYLEYEPMSLEKAIRLAPPRSVRAQPPRTPPDPQQTLTSSSPLTPQQPSALAGSALARRTARRRGGLASTSASAA